MSSVELAGVTVSFGGRRLLDEIDLLVPDGQRFALLGPSGSGKTTVLRVVAGLQPPDGGRVVIGGRDVTASPPRDRDVSLVTQDGTLQPHVDVEHNLAFALRLRRLPRQEVDARVHAEARAFSLLRLLRRRPATLSAGERHEVSLARSLVRRPSVLLADEPFARIDLPRRDRMLRELIRVQEGYQVTLLLATNDQRVALGVAHRIAVISDGRLMQVGPPQELHLRPATAFVATFLGDQPTSLLDAELARIGGRTVLRAPGVTIPTWELALTGLPPQRVQLGIRPDHVELADEDREALAVLDGVVAHREYLGHTVVITASTPAGMLRARCDPPGPAVGERVSLTLPPARIHVFAADGSAVAHGV